jgi:hypothetical protein
MVTSIIGSIIDYDRQVHEAQVSAAWTPGDLLVIDTLKTKRNPGASSQTRKMFGLESPSKGGTIDTDTVADERAPYVIARAGDRIYAWLADTVAVINGDTHLVSNGDGSLKAYAGTEDDSEIVGIAKETKTASGKTRCWIEAA